ncbi:hypothetical protein [Agitococcus lubricus]|uniref:Uncharacterized protein n=1 Tax=Agitococcus lubricus TaxID=1077255 RepID=A0A2T5ISH0_9GAMM|nr:hypothetical protein [Agitococcus lubricus]PTQ86785.1 hypothetical protein C8N29_1284 [Agitococcus lubricus]
MAARKKEAIADYLHKAPSKAGIVELIYHIQTCLLCNSGQDVSKEAIEDKLRNLSSQVMQPYFHFAVYPKWLYRGFILQEDTYDGTEVTPSFGKLSGMQIPLMHDGKVNLWYLIHFKASEDFLPDQAHLSKVLKLDLYQKWITVLDPVASEYIKAKFPFLADAQSHKDLAGFERITDFYTCAKFVFYQVYLAGLYCYLTDLERGHFHAQQHGTGKHYHSDRKDFLHNTLTAIKQLDFQLRENSQRFSFNLPYSKEQWAIFADSRWQFELELDWYRLFKKIGDFYFETAFVFRMIGSLLDHGLNEEVVAEIVYGLIPYLRREPGYDKLIKDKIKTYVSWHQNQLNDYGMSKNDLLAKQFDENFDHEEWTELVLCVFEVMVGNARNEINVTREPDGMQHVGIVDLDLPVIDS